MISGHSEKKGRKERNEVSKEVRGKPGSSKCVPHSTAVVQQRTAVVQQQLVSDIGSTATEGSAMKRNRMWPNNVTQRPPVQPWHHSHTYPRGQSERPRIRRHQHAERGGSSQRGHAGQSTAASCLGSGRVKNERRCRDRGRREGGLAASERTTRWRVWYEQVPCEGYQRRLPQVRAVEHPLRRTAAGWYSLEPRTGATPVSRALQSPLCRGDVTPTTRWRPGCDTFLGKRV